MTTDPTPDFDGCNSECRKASKHTLRWGGCEHAPKPEPTVSMSKIYTDPEDGYPSIGFDSYTVAELARLIEPAVGDPLRAVAAARAIVHRNDPDAAPAATAPDQTLRDRVAEALISWTYRGKEPDPETGILETVRANAYSRADAVLAALFGPIPAGTDTATWTAIRAIQLMSEAGRQRDAALSVPPSDGRAGAYLLAVDAIEHMQGYPRLVLPEEIVAELRRMAAEDPHRADRAAVSATLWAAAEHHTVAEWICCDPIDPTHDLCTQGGAALRLLKALLVDDPDASKPAPLLDQVMGLATGTAAGEQQAQQDGTEARTTADKAEALGMTPAEYRAHCHRTAEEQIRTAACRLYADAGVRVLAALDLSDGPVRCPLCPCPVTLHTPSGARAHFTAVHPEQRVTGRDLGPWPLLVTGGAEAWQQPDTGAWDVPDARPGTTDHTLTRRQAAP